MATKNTVKLSLPATVTVRGYEIKRMPLGKMLAAIEALRELPGDLMALCFPNMNGAQILAQLKGFSSDMMTAILGNALTAAPAHVVRVFAMLSGIPEDQLLEDEAVGLDGLMELIDAWIEVNGIENFFKAVRPLVEKIKAAAGSFHQQKTGSNA